MFRQSWSPHYGSRRPRWVPSAVASNPSNINANTDALVITEQVAGVALNRTIAANTDALVIAEQVAAVAAGRQIAAGFDQLRIGGYSLTGSVHYVLNGAGDYDYGVLEQLPDGFGDGEFTFEMWVQCTNTGNVGQTSSGSGIYTNWATENETPYSDPNWWYYGNFLIDGHTNNGNEFGTFSLQVFNSGRVRWLFGDGSAAGARVGDMHAIQSASGTSIIDGNWHKIACVRRWDGGTGSILELYVDGVQQDTETSTARTNQASSYWDTWSGYNTNHEGWFFGAEKFAALGGADWADFKGRVTEIAFWSIARDSTALTTNWRDSPSPGASGLVGLYLHDEGTGTTISDALGSGGDIVLNNPDPSAWSTDVPDTSPKATISLDRTIAATSDTLTITERTATVNLARAIAAAVDALTITERVATLTRVFSVLAGLDTLVISELGASVQTGGAINAGTDTLTITERTAALNWARNVAAIADALVITERTASVSQGSAISAATDALVITERQASLNRATNLAAQVASLILTERQANVNFARTLAATADALTITERQAAIGLGTAIAAAFDQLTITERQAAVSGTSAVIDVAAARLVRLAASQRLVTLDASTRTITLH